MNNRLRLYLFTLALLVELSAYPQTQNRSVSDQPIKLTTELVVLDAEVLNKKTGRMVERLGKQDFSLLEDGVEQQITHFSQDKLPLSVVLLVDVSGSVLLLFGQIRAGALQAFRRLKAEDEVALMAFAGNTALLQGFTTNRELILDKMEEAITASVVGATFISEAVYQAAALLHKASSPTSRRIIIIVTDNISTQKRSQGHAEGETLHELYESGAVVCGIVVDSRDKLTKLVDKYPLTPLMKKLMFTGDVRVFAKKTSGLVVAADKEDMESKITELVDRLRNRYSIGYISSNQKRDGKFRKLKLKASREVENREGGLVIITRKGYFAKRGDAADAAVSKKPEKEK